MSGDKTKRNHIPAQSEKKAYMEQMFTSIAPTYDLLNRILSFGEDERWRRQAAQYCQIETGLVLDIATGTGKMASILAKRPGVRKVVGLDLTSAMLIKAKSRLAKHKKNITIELVRGDAENLPFPDATFDCVTITYALRNVTDIIKTFTEMTRVVRTGGRVISLELSRPNHGLFQKLYYFYIQRITPFLGGLISRKREAYRYLPDSVMAFATPQELKVMMEKAGLKEIIIQRLHGGATTIHIGTRTLL